MVFIGAICPQLSTDNERSDSIFQGIVCGMKIAIIGIGKEEE